MKPERIQLRRTSGWRRPANTLKVDRSTIVGNPFGFMEIGPEQSVMLHRRWIEGAMTDDDLRARYPHWAATLFIERRKQVLEALPKLRGKNLACWCALPAQGTPDCCHAAVLLEMA